jgi:hypothetical protein
MVWFEISREIIYFWFGYSFRENLSLLFQQNKKPFVENFATLVLFFKFSLKNVLNQYKNVEVNKPQSFSKLNLEDQIII